MTGPLIWYLIKFFTDEAHADRFMAGDLYLNRLSYFRELESESDDGRPDNTEAVAMWWQPDDLIMTLTVPGIGETRITKADLAAPVSIAYVGHDHLHLYCMHAVHTTGFTCVDGKFDLAPEQVAEFEKQLRIDERCFKFGKYAVITPAVPFLKQLKIALQEQGFRANGKLVKYYDDEVFHGEIKPADIPFSKQKRFSYQREFRLCVYPRTIDNNPITINIGDIASICGKVEAARLNDLFVLKLEPAP